MSFGPSDVASASSDHDTKKTATPRARSATTADTWGTAASARLLLYLSPDQQVRSAGRSGKPGWPVCFTQSQSQGARYAEGCRVSKASEKSHAESVEKRVKPARDCVCCRAGRCVAECPEHDGGVNRWGRVGGDRGAFPASHCRACCMPGSLGLPGPAHVNRKARAHPFALLGSSHPSSGQPHDSLGEKPTEEGGT